MSSALPSSMRAGRALEGSDTRDPAAPCRSSKMLREVEAGWQLRLRRNRADRQVPRGGHRSLRGPPPRPVAQVPAVITERRPAVAKAGAGGSEEAEAEDGGGADGGGGGSASPLLRTNRPNDDDKYALTRHLMSTG